MSMTLRYLGPGSRFRMPGYDIDAARGETFEVPDDATVDVSEEGEPADEVALTVYLSEHTDGDFESVTTPYDILDESIPKLRDALATGEYDDRLGALQHAEREGEDRVGAHDAINARRDYVTEGREPDDEADVPGADDPVQADSTSPEATPEPDSGSEETTESDVAAADAEPEPESGDE